MENNTLDLFGQFARVEWLLHRYHQQIHRDHGPMGDPHRGQGRVLALLKLKPEISQKDLLNILDMRSQSLGELLSKLERSGYITRTTSETDGRVMDIHLTKEGKDATSENEHKLDTEKSFECLNEDEQTNLSDYLCRIITGLENQFEDSELKPDFQDHPHFCGRDFGGNFHMGGHHPHPPFHGRDFGEHPDMNGRPPFDKKDFSQHTEEGNKPEDSNEK